MVYFLINGFLQIDTMVIALEITVHLTHQTHEMHHTLTLVLLKAVNTSIKINRYGFKYTNNF